MPPSTKNTRIISKNDQNRKKYEKISKELKQLFSQNAASPNQSNFVTQPTEKSKSIPKYIELPKSDLEYIKKSTFIDRIMLRQAIDIGEKLASDKQNRSKAFSQFKRIVNGWSKEYKKLKPEDFKNKSKKWEKFIRIIIRDTQDYWKTIRQDSQGNEFVISKNDSIYTEQLIKDINVLKGMKKKFENLNKNQLDFLHHSGLTIKDSTDITLLNKLLEECQKNKISSLILYNLLKTENIFEPYSCIDNLNSSRRFRYKNLAMSPEDFSDLLTRLSQLTNEELHFSPSIFTSTPNSVNNMEQMIEYYEQHLKDIIRDKQEFNKSKVHYMEAMSEVAQKALKQHESTSK